MSNTNEKTYALFANPANKKILASLEKAEAKTFRFPPLETAKSVLDENSVAAIKNLNQFDWILFPDVLTVDYFLQILEENEIDAFELDAIRVCAFGETVADRLRFSQVHADVVPASLDSAYILSALTDYVGREALSEAKFLLVKPDLQEYAVRQELIKKKAVIVDLPIYRTNVSNPAEISKLKVLLAGGAIDEFIISSPTDLIALKQYFDNEQISVTLAGINVSTIDRIMFQTLKEHNLTASYLKLK